MSDKTLGQEMYEKLSYTKKNIFEEASAEKVTKIFDYSVGYMQYLDAAKTEREAVIESIKMAEKAGLSVIPAAPSLVPFETKEQWCRDLQGLALKNTAIRVFPIEETEDSLMPSGEAPAASGDPDASERSQSTASGDPVLQGGRQTKKAGKNKKKKKEKPVYEAFGELLFTHFGLSGPVILTASCYCDFERYPQGFRLFMDLKPALSQEQLVERIRREFSEAPNRHLPGAVRPLFPARLAEAVTELSGLGTDRRAAAFTQAEIEGLASLIKKIPVTITGTRGFTEAIITRGGISVKEFNPSTMECRTIRGLFAAGEVLDVDAHTGGFNLQIAWSTGYLAGSSVCV
jgi:predicted flavoprotein YhiN